MSQPGAGYEDETIPEELYLHLMKQCLTRMLWKEKYRPMTSVSGWRRLRVGPSPSALTPSAVGSCPH